ncbi:MAG: hypothetical protein GC129_03365 [Proteobacteria bacterium]|nr:hypothetical protein [Pseudomonadota bacterium]
MHIVFLTRFHSNHTQSGFITRLAAEASAMGHKLTIINPAEIILQFSGDRAADFPVRWNSIPFPDADLILPSARWDDNHTWQIAETLQAWNRPVMLHNRVPLGDQVTMARLFARREIPAPRTWVLSQPAQLAIVLTEITFPCIMRSRYGGSGRRLAVVQHSGEAFTQAQELCKTGQPFMIQDLPLPQGEDVRAMVIGNKVAFAIHRKAPDGFVRPRESGNATITPIELSPEENKVVLAAAQLYGAPFCSVGLLRTEYGPMLLEVARAPTLEELESASEMNLARAIVEHLITLAGKVSPGVVPLAGTRSSSAS